MVSENREAIVAAGGIGRVLAAMAGHEGSFAVQEDGCGALGMLSRGHGTWGLVVGNRIETKVHGGCRQRTTLPSTPVCVRRKQHAHDRMRADACAYMCVPQQTAWRPYRQEE